jgi:hypothetical protein
MDIDFNSLPYSKYGFVEWQKVYKRLTKSELVSHGYEVKPEDFNELRKNYPELYLAMPKDQADNKLLALASLLDQWKEQLTYVVSPDDPRKLELFDPDEHEDIPSLSDLMNLTRSTFLDICLPIRNKIETDRLEKKIAYWQSRIDETKEQINQLNNHTRQDTET